MRVYSVTKARSLLAARDFLFGEKTLSRVPIDSTRREGVVDLLLVRLWPLERGSTGGASRAGADPMATSACAGFCCVAKRFDRPFLRLPAESVSAPDASAGPSGEGDEERWSAADVHARDTDAAAADDDATAGDAANRAETSDLNGDADDSDETEAEETATRARLDEILRTVSERRDASDEALPLTRTDAPEAEGGETASGTEGNSATARDETRVSRVRRAESFPVALLEALAHVSHRRERHCRVILQHACADAVIRGAASFLRRAAAEPPRLASEPEAGGGGERREPSARARETERDVDVSRAGELAALLIRNLAVAASVKEPRDDDETYLDEPDVKHPALLKDGKYDSMTSVVNHALWEGLVRDVFAMCERLARREREKSPEAGARTTRTPPPARPPVPTETAADASASFARDARLSRSASEPDEHAVLCRGALGTYTGAFLALLEPDSARPRLLDMDGGSFVLRVFRCFGSILPARHGDAALDAVGVFHRVLWLRPDATAAERRGLTRALVAMETPLCSLDAREIERVAGARGTETETEVVRPPRAERDEQGAETASTDEQCDPDDLWDWDPRDGYCANARPGEPFHPFRWHPESDRQTLRRLCEEQAEFVSANGVLAGLRTHLPPPGIAGDGYGAAGGTVACTQAVHALRALFEDLQILDAQATHERVLMCADAFEKRTMWRQLRTAQLRELVEQLACVVETLGRGAPSSGDDDEKKKKEKTSGSGSSSEADAYAGVWRGFETVVPKEGQCDGAVGASVAVLNAILHHPFQSATVEEHPSFDRVWNAVTRAMASRCSCLWATFSTTCRLASKGGFAAKKLMSMPSSGCLLNALTSAARDEWPAVPLAEIPPATFLPRRREGVDDAERDDYAAAWRARRERGRRRREAWREKSAKELTKIERAEARKAKKEKRDAARAAATAGVANEPNDADDTTRETARIARRETRGGDSGDSDSADSDSADSDSEDPLAFSSNRLSLRAAAAATLASFARVQRHWDELDRGEVLSKYDQDATLDAIDVDDGTPDGLWRPRTSEEYDKALGFADVPETLEALELWYAARGGDGAGAPSRADLRAAREGVRAAFAAHRAHRADYTDPKEADEAAEMFTRDAQIETWWTMRWRKGLYENRRRGKAAAAAATAAMAAADAPAPESSRDASSKRDAPTFSPGYSDRSPDASEPFQLDAETMRATSWPAHAVRHPQTRKGPLPGNVDPEGVLGTVPLVEDILAVLSEPTLDACDTVSRDALHDTGVAVEAIETLVADDNARWLLLPDAEPVLERLVSCVDETARLAERAAANGGVLRCVERPKGDSDDDDRTHRTDDIPANDEEDLSQRRKRDARRTPPSSPKAKKRRKKKKRKTRVSFGDLCARNALMVHTLYSVTKEAERENEGSAWPVLIARSDVLLAALHSILTQAREDREADVAKGSDAAFAAASDAAATRETVIELCRNALIFLAEMSDPANSQDTPELGAAWAVGVVTRKPWVLDELARVMAAGGKKNGSDAVAVRGAVQSADASDDDGSSASMRLSASVDPDAKMPARFAFASEAVTRTEDDDDAERFSASYPRDAALDCAHIAAAAAFGLLSWDASTKAFMERAAKPDSGLPSADALISRALALLADARAGPAAVSRPDDVGAADPSDPEEAEPPDRRSARSGQKAHLRGAEAAGLLARLAGDDDGRRALVAGAPGIVGYLVPCLDARLGQTAAFAARALSSLARGEASDAKMPKTASCAPAVLEKYPYPEKLVVALTGMLAASPPSGATRAANPETAGESGDDAVAANPFGYLEDAVEGSRDAGLEAHVLSEAVVAVATLAQAKPWRWRLVNVCSTSLATPPPAIETADDDASAGRRAPEAASALVTHLARLLGNAERPEIAFNALYCVNCLMGEPPQSWGRGRDASRAEDHAARRAFITAAAKAEGVPIELRLAEILHPEFAREAMRERDDAEDGDAPPPDCRLNATLVIANIAGDAEGRRRLLEVAGDRLVSGLAAAIVGPDPERAMLATYSLGELARPLPGVELALGGATRAERAARGAEDRLSQPDDDDDGHGLDGLDGLDDAFVKALPFLALARAGNRGPAYANVAASAFGAASAARAVLRDGEAHIREWIARGDAAVDGAVSEDKTYGYARDHSAQRVLRALPLPVKRKWLLEMLRWELGSVSAGVPVPGVASVALTVDRAKVLRDLCKHCELPDDLAPARTARAFASAEFQDTDSSGDEAEAAAPASEAPAEAPEDARAARGAFLPPPVGGVSVRFSAERGEGAALRREWFGLVAEKSADHTHGLFVSHDGGRSLHPHACSGTINPKTHLKYFAALGRVAAVALYHGETLPLRLTDAFYARAVLGARASLEDLKSVDPALYANKVRYLLDLSSASAAEPEGTSGAEKKKDDASRRRAGADADATLRALDLEWSDAVDPTGVFSPGETRAFAFLPPFPERGDGRSPASAPAVTSETLGAYLRAFAAHRTYGGAAWQTAAFAAGFGAVVPHPLRNRMRSVLCGAELAVLVAGEPGDVDVADWKTHAGYSDVALSKSFSARCFWHALERVLTRAERVDVLQFATGLVAPPAGGFANLVGYAGDAAPFTVAELASDTRDAPGALPMAHACFNTIRLPRLAEREFGGSVEAGSAEMARRLRIATSHGARGFDNF